MKKTLIALAVVASAAVSGSAMAAWTTSGTGGTFTMSGELTPKDKVTPWEVKVYNGATSLNAEIVKNKNTVDIAVQNYIPVLGIRNHDKNGFLGSVGRTAIPQIDFKGKLKVDTFSAGKAQIELKVTDPSGATELGTLTAPLSTAALTAWNNGWSSVAAPNDTMAFWGGVSADLLTAMAKVTAKSFLTNLDPEILEKWEFQVDTGPSVKDEGFYNGNDIYKVAYGAGFEPGAKLSITLNTAPASDTAIQWKAELPIEVSYR
ncbi:hypothetical protein I3A70_14115 [Salmonella enterica]|nr:hypothetical protein [Salmonella enterica]